MLAPGVRACNFCESTEDLAWQDEVPETTRELPQTKAAGDEWRGELNQRLNAYRARRRKHSPNDRQSALPFEEHEAVELGRVAVQDEALRQHSRGDDFAFTIAIGRIAQKQAPDKRVVIDVSSSPEPQDKEPARVTDGVLPVLSGILPVASVHERCNALLIDAACLAFAYGSFLALFGSLGGHFTLSKLSAAVCFFTFAFVYLQYFGLFTIFGGNTPGMMLTGLQVASSTGDLPTPRQYALRAAGYVLSAGTCFLGFLWVLWDEDKLTWHDRVSRTYLRNVETFGEEDTSHATSAR